MSDRIILETNGRRYVAVEWCAVQCAMAMYADYHKRHGNAKYAKEVKSYVK